MPLFQYKSLKPTIANNTFIAPGAMVIGDVTLEENVNIWHNTVIRADVNFIKIGKNTNIQDLSMLHVTELSPIKIGENVSVGHSVTLHGCTVESHCLIGMNSTILDNAYIEKDCIVAAGSVVTPNKRFPSGHMIMGTPAKAVRKLTLEELNFVRNHYKSYLTYKDEFLQNCSEL